MTLPHDRMKRRDLLFLIIFACTTIVIAADQPCPTKISFAKGATSAPLPGVAIKDQQVFVSVRINGSKEDLRFVFAAPCSIALWPADSGCDRPPRVQLVVSERAEWRSML